MQDTEIQMVPLALYQELQQEMALLQHELAQLKRLIFGTKSERFVPIEPLPGQLQLDLGLEAAPTETETKKEVITYERNKQQPAKITPHGREPLPAWLPRQEIIIEPEQDTVGMKHIGDEVTEELEYQPGKLFVRRFIRPKYAASPEAKQAEVEIPAAAIIAPLPVRPIEKGILGPGLLAHLLVSKIVDHLPLYRQMKMFERQEVKIAGSTLGDWFRAACNLLVPLYDAQKRLVLASRYLQADSLSRLLGKAAQRLAMLYTFMASCKANGVNPYEWLRDVFIRLPEQPINRVEELLPHLWKPLDVYPWWLTEEV